DMAIDTDDLPTSFSNASGDFRELRNTVMHELGHGVGLDHVNSDAAGILMEPIISVGFDGPQHDDIRGLQWLYGDPLEKSGGNNTAANASPLGVLSPGGSLAVGTAGTGHVVGGNETDFVSISNERDTDFFSFSIASPVRLDATLTPRGDSYDQDGAFFNTTQTSDLALTILGPDGTTVLRQAAGQPAGVAESVAGVVLPSPGTYFARVTGPSATNSVVQLYQLDLSASAAGPALPGDFNGNGVVDAADFTLWRDSEGAFVAAFSGADHSGNGRVDAADRTIWRNGFGDTASASAVPEPATIVWLPVAAACCAARSRNDGRQPVR
ncbi:MAG: pre-peptidase C-terminal domain-containing protein, partial [Planctomycetota bacterium]